MEWRDDHMAGMMTGPIKNASQESQTTRTLLSGPEFYKRNLLRVCWIPNSKLLQHIGEERKTKATV